MSIQLMPDRESALVVGCRTHSLNGLWRYGCKHSSTKNEGFRFSPVVSGHDAEFSAGSLLQAVTPGERRRMTFHMPSKGSQAGNGGYEWTFFMTAPSGKCLWLSRARRLRNVDFHNSARRRMNSTMRLRGKPVCALTHLQCSQPAMAQIRMVDLNPDEQNRRIYSALPFRPKILKACFAQSTIPAWRARCG